MRRIEGERLWIGHVGDADNPEELFDVGVKAVVHLAANEVPLRLPREIAYCHFPLTDGLDNPGWLLRAAVLTVATFISSRVPTLVCCNSGVSRSPAVVAAALAQASGMEPADCLTRIAARGGADVTPALWQGLLNATGAEGEPGVVPHEE